MDMTVIGSAHWMYLLGVIAIVVTMIFRANVVVPAIFSTFIVVLAWTHNPIIAVSSIFNASFVAAKELFNILRTTGNNELTLAEAQQLQHLVIEGSRRSVIRKWDRLGFVISVLFQEWTPCVHV